MRIVFLLKSTGISGGVRVVFEHANRLRARGHEVFVVHPVIMPYISSGEGLNLRTFMRFYWRIRNAIKNLFQKNSIDWFPLKAKLIKVPTLTEKYIPNADIVVATRWETAYSVSRFSQKKGEKFYLIQHYEIWCGPEDKVNATYAQLGLHNIVVSNWIKKILKEKLKAKVEAVVPNGVNLEQFYPEKIRREDNMIRILMPYREQKWKGIDDGLKAFEIVKQKHPEVKLVMFGPVPDRKLPPDVEFHKLPYGDKLRKIYNSCDIFIFPSHYEGFGLPPMEAMACKCAVATTDVGGVSNYTIPGKTALISKPRDIKALADNIKRLIENPNERKKIAENGYNFIQKFGWEQSTDKLEKIFQKYI